MVVPSWLSEQVELSKPPVPVWETVTVPVGADLVPASVSLTVVVQVEPWLTATVVGEQTTLVEVERLLTVTDAVPELVECVLSPR